MTVVGNLSPYRREEDPNAGVYSSGSTRIIPPIYGHPLKNSS
jgi:hypothetical protein